MEAVDMYIFYNMSIHYFNIDGIMDCVKVIGVCDVSLLRREGLIMCDITPPGGAASLCF